MKKVSIVAAILLAAETVGTWGQEVDSFLVGPIPVTMEGKLISTNKGSGTVTGESVNGTDVEFAVVQLLATDVSTDTLYIIGSGLSLVTTNQAQTNVIFTGTEIWDGGDAVVEKESKGSTTTLVEMRQIQQVRGVDTDVTVSNSASATGENVISNSVLLVTITSSEKASKTGTNETGSAKFFGIWNEFDGTAVSGTIKAETTKSKK
jgi:hypothetical protein